MALGRCGEAGARAVNPVVQDRGLGEELVITQTACAKGRHVMALKIRQKTATIDAVSL